MLRAALFAALALGQTTPAEACRLALLLALDVSSSVDALEDHLQREGLAAAFEDPVVREAFLTGAPVALAVYEWSGKYQQDQVLGWRLIGSEAALDGAAAAVRGSLRRETAYPTALGYALAHAIQQFKHAPACRERTLDVSGDGENNDGFPPPLAYENFPFDGITVNALAIGNDPTLVAYFEADVIRGPGAFVEAARDYPDYARAIRRKLLRELEPKAVGWLER